LARLDRELPYGLDEVSTVDLEEWLSPYRGWTLYTFQQGIRDFCRYAADVTGEPDPAAGLPRIKPPDDEPRPASDAEVDQALTALSGVALIAVTLAAFDGLRCREICLLDREHIDERTLWVQRKGVKTQLLPTHDLVWPRVADLPPGPVVRAARGGRFRPNYLSAWVSGELDRIGLPNVTLHRFRAAFATRLANAGVHATVIQDLMGHKHLNTTQRYVKVTNGQRRDAITTLPVPASQPPTRKAAA
jgi:integrase